MTPVRVVIDTSTFFAGSFRAPLFASAREGDLAVFWSPAIEREIIKVSYREAVLAALRSQPNRQAQAVVSTTIRQVFEKIAERIEAQLGTFERVFARSSNLDTVDDTLLDAVGDTADRPVLRAALAEEARFILSLDQRHFTHGTILHGVQCWHPDTFLTLFYQQNLPAYERVLRSVVDLPPEISLRLLP